MNNDLELFPIAQQICYRTALQEIKSGQRRSCPQMESDGMDGAVSLQSWTDYRSRKIYQRLLHMAG